MSVQAQDLMAEADKLLELMSQGKIPHRAAPPATDSVVMDGGFQLQCDVNGCSIVPVSKADAGSSPSGDHPALAPGFCMSCACCMKRSYTCIRSRPTFPLASAQITAHVTII